MKKMIFGITLFIGGLLGILVSMLIPTISAQALGVVNDSTNIFSYLNWFGMIPFFIYFVIISSTGIIICIKETYFSK